MLDLHVHVGILLCFQICCQFDSKRLPGTKVTCPWKIKPQPITDSNRYTLMHITIDTMIVM